jgi:hypothetical protein
LGEVNSLDDQTASGAMFEVRIALSTNRAGRYIWSASDGPATPIVSGTPCLIKIQVENQRPIEKIFNLVS